MVISEEIRERVERLPVDFQTEVLNFVEYLLIKAEEEEALEERRLWSKFSLTSAMRGMEDEEGPTYTEDDLKEVFR